MDENNCEMNGRKWTVKIYLTKYLEKFMILLMLPSPKCKVQISEHEGTIHIIMSVSPQEH